MNPLKKGPQLKLSEIKVPQFLSDLYWDLRDRYLLPAVIVLVIAIVAVPLLLSRSSSSSAPEYALEESIAGEVAGASSVPPAGGELVAKAAPGLRDYRRRLRELKEKDPFTPQFSAQPAESTSSSASSGSRGISSAQGSAAPSEAPAPAMPEPSEQPPPSESSPPSEPTTDDSGLQWFSYAIDVRVVSLGERGRGASSSTDGSNVAVRRSLPELTTLPSREAPAAIYMGVTKDGRKALMMISDKVQGIFGDAVCVLGSQKCQLLAMEPGLPVTFVYGPSERTYKIELLKLRLLNTDHLNRAPLGSSKNEKRKRPTTEGLAQLAPRG